MDPTFHVHIHRAARPDWPTGWVADGAGRTVALWGYAPPAPGAHPGAYPSQYDADFAGTLWSAGTLWRIVTPDHRCVAFDIPDEPTAHALLAWLCPKE